MAVAEKKITAMVPLLFGIDLHRTQGDTGQGERPAIPSASSPSRKIALAQLLRHSNQAKS